MNEELKPCPFCECDDMEVTDGIVRCHSCGTYAFLSEWNDRPIESSLLESNADLRRYLSILVDSMCLPGHLVTDEEWENACMLSGRYCYPFMEQNHRFKKAAEAWREYKEDVCADKLARAIRLLDGYFRRS